MKFSIIKLTLLGLIPGFLASVILSLLTAEKTGFNVVTGEPMVLTGWQAVYVQLNETGLGGYVVSTLPLFLICWFAISALLGVLSGRHSPGE